ncbi:hypothetical protein JXO52_09395 [bacterium]|nr:hypothetical protein [bacterium]
MNDARIQSFIYLGYFLDFVNPDISFDFSGIDKSRYADVPYPELLAKAVSLYREAVSAGFESGALNFIPLSGGLDSRAILALLLEQTEAAAIHTYTFGTPGTMDYDIGCALAGKVGTNHTACDLSRYQCSMDELLQTSERLRQQIMLFTHPPLSDLDKHYRGGVLWSGFIGGRTSGSYLPHHPSPTIEEAKRRYIEHNHLAKSVPLTDDVLASMTELVDWDGGTAGEISLDERLDLINRQVKYTVINNALQGYRYRLPFAHPPLFNFLFSLPDRYRFGQKLYIDVFLTYFRDIFNYPSKTTVGLPVNAPPFLIKGKTRLINLRYHVPGFQYLIKDPFINYCDFAKRIRTDSDFQQLIRGNVRDLDKRGLIDWIDLESVWSQHMSRTADHSLALLTLASLEIHLKAGKQL